MSRAWRPAGWRRIGDGGEILAALGAQAALERGRWFLWLPVLVACGAAAWILPARAPGAGILAWAALIAAAAAPGLRRSGAVFAVSVVILGMGAGYGAAALRSAVVAAPVLMATLDDTWVEGPVLSVSAAPARTGVSLRWIMRPTRLDGAPPDAMPGLVRLRWRSPAGEGDVVRAGDVVRVRARLFPPPRPAEPGAHDFSRRMWFQGIGATGRALEPPQVLHPAALSLPERARVEISRLRRAVARRVQQVLDRPGIPTALITGDRTGIPRAAQRALRDAGLAHVLAISGLHMALVSGAVFGLVRWMAAWWPWFALRYPVRKWAAGAAFGSAVFYLFLSGAGVATQRAFFMVAVVTLAVFHDRPALTLRNVAIAALIILLLRPESLLDAGFQMSFAAVTALVAVYEVVNARRAGLLNAGRGLAGRLAGFVTTLALTSLVASAATGMLAAYHFNRMAIYALAANLVAVPVLGVFVMPLALAGVLLMPLGLEAVPLRGMALGVDVMLAAAREVSAWPGAVRLVPAAPPASLAAFALGGCWLCLWRRRWRWAALLPLALAVILAWLQPRPDVLVDMQARTVGVLNEQGIRVSARPRRATYAMGVWRRRDGTDAQTARGAHDPWRCDDRLCRARLAHGRVAYAETQQALARACAHAAADAPALIVIAAVNARSPCPAARVFLDAADMRRHGAHALWVDAGGIRVRFVTAAPPRQ